MEIHSSKSYKRPLFNKEEYEQSLFFGPAESEDDKKAEIFNNDQPLNEEEQRVEYIVANGEIYEKGTGFYVLSADRVGRALWFVKNYQGYPARNPQTGKFSWPFAIAEQSMKVAEFKAADSASTATSPHKKEQNEGNEMDAKLDNCKEIMKIVDEKCDNSDKEFAGLKIKSTQTDGQLDKLTRVDYISRNSPYLDPITDQYIPLSERIAATERYLKEQTYWPKRNPTTGEFMWPLEPDQTAPWSISCDVLHLEDFSAPQKHRNNGSPSSRSKAKRQLRLDDGRRPTLLAKRRGITNEPLEILIQPDVSRHPVITRHRMIHESASKAAVIDERNEGTSTTENYTVEERPDGTMVRRIISLHSWQTFRADSVYGCFEQMDRALNQAIKDEGNALSKLVIDETKVGFLKPEWL